VLSSLNGIKKPNNNGNNFIIKSPKLMSIIVENILKLLYLRDFIISELLVELQKRWPYSSSSSSCKLFKKYLVYLADNELISYNGQRKTYFIEGNGLDLLN